MPSLTEVVPEYSWVEEISIRPAPSLVTFPPFQIVPVTFRSLLVSEPDATSKIALEPLRLKPSFSAFFSCR